MYPIRTPASLPRTAQLSNDLNSGLIEGSRSGEGQHVLVLQGTQVQSGILVDLSEGGFGLSKVDRIAPDELISVAMLDGRILEGRVVWTKESRAGVALMSRS
jgi:PilZ domain